MKTMKKVLAFTLAIAFVSFIFAPVSAFAGGRNYGHGGGHQVVQRSDGYHGGGHQVVQRSHSGVSTGAAVIGGIALFGLGMLVGRESQPTVVYGPQQYPHYPVPYPQPVYVPQQPSVVFVHAPATAPPVVVIPHGVPCQPTWDRVYDDPYNPGIPRFVANPYRLDCNGQIVVIPR